jgi:putative membrane protein
MKSLLVHLLVSALLLALVDYFIDGITIAGFGYALLAAVALGIVNALLRPVLVILTLPITVLTLGLFLLVINALMMLLAAAVVPGFQVTSFGAAFLGAVLLAVFNLVASAVLHGDTKKS